MEKRLIDANAFLKDILTAGIGKTIIEYSESDIAYMIRKRPTVDAVEVVHGRWVSVPHKLARVCSVCNRDEPYKFADIDADMYDYCPFCGAKMDLRRDGDGT